MNVWQKKDKYFLTCYSRTYGNHFSLFKNELSAKNTYKHTKIQKFTRKTPRSNPNQKLAKTPSGEKFTKHKYNSAVSSD